jgi:hypothetical protein
MTDRALLEHITRLPHAKAISNNSCANSAECRIQGASSRVVRRNARLHTHVGGRSTTDASTFHETNPDCWREARYREESCTGRSSGNSPTHYEAMVNESRWPLVQVGH